MHTLRLPIVKVSGFSSAIRFSSISVHAPRSSSFYEYEVWDEAHAYWGNFLSLGNSVALQVYERKSLLLYFDFTLLGLHSRPDLYRLYANEYWTFSHIVIYNNLPLKITTNLQN